MLTLTSYFSIVSVKTKKLTVMLLLTDFASFSTDVFNVS